VSAQSSTESSGKNTTELKSAVEGKTKSEVKEFFGRAPDDVSGGMWVYMGQYVDPDAEKVLRQCHIAFDDSDKAFLVIFVGG
jgi:hypothetical protein